MGIVEDRSGSGGQVMIRRTGQDQEDVLGSGGWNMGRVEWTARWKRDLMDSVWTGGLCRRQTTAVSLEIRVFF